MKQLTFFLTCLFFISFYANAQVETVPAEYIVKPMSESQTKKILEIEVRGFLEPIVNKGWEEGVAAIKSMVDPGQKKINKEYLKNEVYNKLRNDYHFAEFQDGDDLFLNISAELGAFKGILPIIPGRKATVDSDIGPIFIMLFFELPKGKTIQSRGDFDPLKAYDLNPNDLSFIGDKLPKAIIAKAKKNPGYLKRVFGLTLIQRPAQPYKIYVDNLPKNIIDGDFGPATGLKTTGDIQNNKDSEGAVTKVKNGQPMGFSASDEEGISKVKAGQPMGFAASDDEIRTAKKTSDAFLRSIRTNNLVGFSQHLPVASEDELMAVKTKTEAKGLLNKYRQLPEYLTHDPVFEAAVVIDQNGSVVNWDGVSKVVTWNPMVMVAVYRLPQGKKASQVRAPTDILNKTLFPEGDRIVVVDLERIKFEKTPNNFYGTIIGGPLIGTLIGKGNHPENYITVIVHKEKGANNFNIGWPPSLRQ